MATVFLEPGGDADFSIATTNGFWTTVTGTVTVASDIVHGSHLRSIQPAINGNNHPNIAGIVSDAGNRESFYVYINAYPTSATRGFLTTITTSASLVCLILNITTTGVLQLFRNAAGTQIGSNGATLSTGQWYRISLAWTVSSTTVNRFEVFVDGVSSISVTNATITNTGFSNVSWGTSLADTTLDLRFSDLYIDDSSALTDTGDVWVTAKRPFSNGTANNFTTQIGSGGSGYGSGHAPQVNERALSKTNGWSMIGAGSAVTEEYSVEPAASGDIDMSGNSVVDWLGWVSADATVGETASIIAGGISSSYTTPAATATRLVTKIVGSTVYPVGGTDVGIVSDTSLTTLNLYECGVIVAFIGPPKSSSRQNSTLALMGVG